MRPSSPVPESTKDSVVDGARYAELPVFPTALLRLAGADYEYAFLVLEELSSHVAVYPDFLRDIVDG